MNTELSNKENERTLLINASSREHGNIDTQITIDTTGMTPKEALAKAHMEVAYAIAEQFNYSFAEQPTGSDDRYDTEYTNDLEIFRNL